MKVKFRQNWFGPNGQRYRRDVVHTVNDEWKSRLPKSAQIIEEEVAPAPEPKAEPAPEPESKAKPDIKL